MSNESRSSAPVVVIGAGLAGLVVALQLAARRPVVVLAKRGLDEAATAWAQGGIVGVLGSDDSVESHVRDTQDAGAGLVDEHTARFIAQHSAAAIEWVSCSLRLIWRKCAPSRIGFLSWRMAN